MEYLKIQSQGEIEARAFTLIGNSTKRGDASQIGMFGSGLKYAISSLLRNNINFKVFSGTKELDFSLRKEGFRNTEFQVICLNGQETSFTSSMGGEDWDNPFAPIREIYSNALDEDEDAILDKSYGAHGNEDTTSFFIEMTPDVRDFYKNLDLYFCQKNENVLFSNRAGSVYKSTRQGLRMFRKGILCYQRDFKGQYNYNSPHFVINESRVLNNSGLAAYTVGDIWKMCKDSSLILQFLQTINEDNSYSRRIDFQTNQYIEHQTSGFSKAWEQVVRENKFAAYESVFLFEASQLAGRIFLPYALIEALRIQFHFIDVIGLRSKGRGVVYNVIEKPTQIIVDKVTDSMSSLMKTRYKSRLEDPVVKYCKFENEGTLALADDGVIYLSVKLESKSIPEISKIIIEENEHNRTGFKDKSRAFQDHLFDLYYDELEYSSKLKRLVE